MLACSLALEGRLDEADGLLREARFGNPAYPDTTHLQVASVCNWIAGRFRASADAWRESLAWTRGATSSRRGWGIPAAAVSMAELGEPALAREWLARASETQPWQLTSALGAWAASCIAADMPAQERAAGLADAAATLHSQGCLPYAAFADADLAEAALAAGDLGTAERAAVALQEMVFALDRAPYRGLAELGRACERLLAADRGAAVNLARRAAARFGGIGALAFQARALHLLGLALVSSDPAQARVELEAAIEGFTGCGAVRRRDASLRALAALGQDGRRAASAHARPRELTPRERDVVRLAVEGRTARQIGDRLHIGERTVETHLANAYVKLGVASRVDLVRRAEQLGI